MGQATRDYHETATRSRSKSDHEGILVHPTWCRDEGASSPENVPCHDKKIPQSPPSVVCSSPWMCVYDIDDSGDSDGSLSGLSTWESLLQFCVNDACVMQSLEKDDFAREPCMQIPFEARWTGLLPLSSSVSFGEGRIALDEKIFPRIQESEESPESEVRRSCVRGGCAFSQSEV